MQTTLPQKYYTDPAVFADELERFYCRSWVCAGRAAQIPEPGDYFLREIGKESIIIARGADREIRAFFNVCRHRGTRICANAEGRFPGRIQCGYHGWTYALDGKLAGAPHMNQQWFRMEDFPLHTIRAEIWEGHIFINLDAGASTLKEQLGNLWDKFKAWGQQELCMAARRSYTVQANWKLLVVNYNECLHCPIIHPLLNRITHYLSGANDPPSEAYVGGSMNLKNGAETMSVNGKRPRGCLPGLVGQALDHVLYYTVYPNLFLSLHPDYVMTHTLWPRAVNQTEVICEWHFHPNEMQCPEFDASDAVEFWDTTNHEDWRVCELAQLGIQSRAYQPGPYSPLEGLPKAFDQMILGVESKEEKNSKPRIGLSGTSAED